MDKLSKRQKVFRIILYLISGLLFLKSAVKISITDTKDIFMFLVFLFGCLVISLMTINVGKAYIELSDAIIACVFIAFGRSAVVVFCAMYGCISFFMNEKLIYKKDRASIFFNAAMFIIGSYLTSTIIEKLIPAQMKSTAFGLTVTCTCYVSIFLFINILLFIIDYSLDIGKLYKPEKEAVEMLPINFLVSTMLTITMCMVRSSNGIVGSILVLGILIIIHYCFYIYAQLNIRNESIKGLLKITSDIVKYGDFRDQCKYLILNLKELIPYTICAIYTFDLDNDSMSFPVAFNCPDGVDIGEFRFDISNNIEMVNTIKEGLIYISKDTKENSKIKLGGKIVDSVDSVVLVPVIVADKVSGLILIGGDKNLEDFIANGADDILNILSNQMALAIENDGIYRNIKSKADIDPLTKLFNRRAFDKEITELINSKTSFSMVMYDIDDFKHVNDTYGHLVGDEVLKVISEEIKKSIRKTDVPCRYGGEEIVIIFKDLTKEDAFIISDRIRRKIETTNITYGNMNVSVTVSGGVSSYPEDGMTKDEIIENADNVLYSECKHKGKNKVFAYNFKGEKIISLNNPRCSI